MAGLIPFDRRGDLFYDTFQNMMEEFFSDWPFRRAIDAFKVDVQERENDYLVEAELPGVRKEEVSVTLEDKRLTIAVNRMAETEEKTKNYIHRERRAASASRHIYLPGAKSEGIKARLENGVLTVTVPKSAPGYRSVSVNIE